jgi:hypothetical protein
MAIFCQRSKQQGRKSPPILELLIVPEALVCAMFHFNLAHNATTVPIGFVSSVPEHIASAGTLVSARTQVLPD